MTVVALGDSITRGKGGMPMLGIHPQSWVQWLAETLGEPLLNLGVDGCTAPDVVRDQLPKLGWGSDPHPKLGRGSDPLPNFSLGTLFIGANDARAPALDVAAFDAAVGIIADALSAACDRVLVLTLPDELGRPHAGKDVERANLVLRRHANRIGATLVELGDLHGPRVMLPDTVHPTSPGMVEIANRALAALGRPERVDAGERGGVWPRLDYARWYLKQVVRDGTRRVRKR